MVDSTCKTCTKSIDGNNGNLEICNNSDLNKCRFNYKRQVDSKRGLSENAIDVDKNEAYSNNNNHRCWGSYNNNSKKMMGLNFCGTKWCCRVSKYEVPHISNTNLKDNEFFDLCKKIPDQKGSDPKGSDDKLFPSEKCSKTWDENKIKKTELKTLCENQVLDPSFPTSKEFENLCKQFECCSNI